MKSSSKSATLYRFNKKNQYLIHSLSTIEMGASIASEPYIWIDETTGLESIVEKILVALKNNKFGLPNPSSWEASAKEFFKSAGLKSNKELHDNVICVEILQLNDKLFFTPMVNLGARKGFMNVSKEKIEVEINKGMVEIASALELALSKCK